MESLCLPHSSRPLPYLLSQPSGGGWTAAKGQMTRSGSADGSGQPTAATAAAAAAVAAVPGVAAADTAPGGGQGMSFPFFPAVRDRYTPEQIQDIFNIAVTVELVAVTIVTAALTTYAERLKLDAPGTKLLQSTVARDQAHVEFFQSLGGKPLTTSFTLPPPLFADQSTLFSAG